MELGQRVYEEREVATHIVHEEEEGSDTQGPDTGGYDLHQNSEDKGEPGLS